MQVVMKQDMGLWIPDMDFCVQVEGCMSSMAGK